MSGHVDTNYLIAVREQGWGSVTQWKVRHDWLERRVGRLESINRHKDGIIDLQKKQIRSLKWDAMMGKVIIGVVVTGVVIGAGYSLGRKIF